VRASSCHNVAEHTFVRAPSLGTEAFVDSHLIIDRSFTLLLCPLPFF